MSSLNENDDGSVVLEEKEPEDLEKLNGINLGNQVNVNNVNETMLDEEDESEEIVAGLGDEEKIKFYSLKLKSLKSYNFKLIFNPKAQKTYSFNLPISLQGNVICEGLIRRVTC